MFIINIQMVTEYLGNTENGCKYNYNKLKDVLYLVSAEHVKDVQIDNGEAYISGLTELPLRINGFNIQFNEETSLDERYKFQKTITLSMNGYVNYRIFGGRYYAILEAEDGTYFMVNVDFPSRITHTFHLSKDVNQTDFTFSSLSNFPTLKLNAEFEAVSPVCLGFRVNGIKSFQLIEKEKARLDTENRTVISTEPFKDIEFLGDSCSFEEIYDGFKVTDTIEFNILLDNYKPSWQINLLEFLENKYSAIIIPKGNDNKFYPGFNFGLEPSYTIQTASQRGQSDIITVVLREASAYGTTAAVDWDEDQDTETRWRWVKQVGDTICYECIGLRRARYLVRQQVDMFGNPTGDYQVMEGYESQYPNFHIVGTFTTEQEFDSLDCDETGACSIISNMPNTIIFNSATCNTYTLRTSCAFEFKNIPANITVSPSTGLADTDYIVTVCNSTTPTSTPSEQNMTLSCCQSNRNITIKVQTENTCVTPETQYINCLGGQVQFAYNGNCRLSITSAPGLTYSVGNNTVMFTVPRNNSTSAITYTIQATNCDCSSGTTTFHIQQDKTYEQWITEAGYICDGNDSYTVERRYTGTTADNINVRTMETRKGTLITSGDTRCSSSESTKWEWDGINYYCQDGDKYQAVFKYISYDIGQTWTKTNNTMLGEMVESASTWCELPVQYKWELTNEYVCESTEYRWYPSGYTCIGYDKWQNAVKQVSLDSGTTWQNVVPEETSATTLIEADSEYCGYVPPEPKWIATYTGGTTSSAECDASSAITSGEVATTDLLSVEIGDCVRSIDSSAFYGCNSLTSATIGSSVTNIGNWAFFGCSSLTNINIGSGVTTISSHAFRSCTSLTSVTIPNSVTSIGNNTFYNCTGLTSVTIGDSVTSIGEAAFEYCTSLTSVTIPNNVTSIGTNAFRDCIGLTSITIGSGVTSIGNSAFNNCRSLTSIEIPSGVTSIENYTFYTCTSLTSATIGNSVTTIAEAAFNRCSGLTSINIPSGVTSIGNSAFYGCSGLTNITVNATTPPTLANSGVFDSTNNCPIYVPCESVNAYKAASGWSVYASRIEGIPPCIPPEPKWIATYTGGTTSSAECDASSAITSGEVTTTDLVAIEIGNCVTGISNSAFTSATTLSSVTIPNTVTNIGASAFRNCYSLSSITIPDSVTSLGTSVFRQCSGLTSVTIGSGVTSIGSDAFYSCSGLTSINIPDSVTRIGDGAFGYCTGLTSVTIPSGVTSIEGWTFYNCISLTSVTIPNSVVAIGNYDFFNCTSLTSVTIPNNVTSIGDNAFQNCSGLTSVVIPDSVTTIGYNAFRYNYGLTNITIPDSVTSIGQGAFGYCTGLTSATIGSGVTSIASWAFEHCNHLTSVTVNATTPPTLGSGVFDYTNNCTIYVSAASVNAYKTASGWSTYADRIQAIS